MQRISMSGFLLGLVACGWLALPSAIAQTYKWTDAQGKVHYSDQPPPPDVKQSATVKPRKPAAPSAPAGQGTPAAAPKTYVEQDAEFKKRQVEAAEREAAQKKAADESAEKKRNCAQAQGQLKTLQAGGRITRYNAKGEQEFISDAQLPQEIEQARKSVDSWCK